jgi:hypothetical protein
MLMHTTEEQKTWISKHSERSEGRTARWCRSVVCGSTPFIPDSEFGGENCELTCSIAKD